MIFIAIIDNVVGNPQNGSYSATKFLSPAHHLGSELHGASAVLAVAL